MSRKLAIAAFAFLMALPACAETRQPSTEPAPSALHLMNRNEFASYLRRLDSAQLQWATQLRSLDVRPLALDRQDRGEMEQSYRLTLQSLDYVGQEIQQLAQKQTLKGDLLLLVDMNDLARNLDELDRDLANATAKQQNDAARKSLTYVREVLDIDVALSSHTAEFRNHVFAFAKLIDAKLAETGDEQESAAPIPQS